MKLLCIAVLAAINVSSCAIAAVAQDFCNQLGAKLKQKSNSNSIVQTIRYNYTVAGTNNYAQLVEYS